MFANRLLSTAFPSRSLPVNSGNALAAAVSLWPALSSAGRAAICSSIERMLSASLFSV